MCYKLKGFFLILKEIKPFLWALEGIMALVTVSTVPTVVVGPGSIEIDMTFCHIHSWI